MKKVLFLGVATLLALCASCGGQKPTPTPSSSDSTPTSESQSGGSESQSGGSESGSQGGESTSQSESTPASTAQTVTVNDAPAAGHVVIAHAWEGEAQDWANHDVVAEVNGTSITFDFGEYVPTIAGICLAELKDGETELGTDWVNVLRKTGDFTTSSTTATWAAVKPDNNFVAVAKGGDWNSMSYFALTVNPEKASEVMNESVTLEVSDVFYINSNFGSDNWLHYADMNPASTAAAAFKDHGDNDHNFEVVTAGTYSFYVTSSTVWVQAAE